MGDKLSGNVRSSIYTAIDSRLFVAFFVMFERIRTSLYTVQLLVCRRILTGFRAVAEPLAVCSGVF